MDNVEQLRQHTRRRVQSEVPVLDTRSGERLGRIFDLTDAGFMLLTPQAFEANEFCHLTLSLPEPSNWEIRLVAECMWCGESSFSDLRGVGFCIERITDDDLAQLRRFLKGF